MCGMARNHLTKGSHRLRFSGASGVVDLQVDRLFVLGGGIPVGQQGRIRADPGYESAELQREVEPHRGYRCRKRIISRVAAKRAPPMPALVRLNGRRPDRWC